MKANSGKRVMSIVAHIVLILLSFMCLFFFAILLINATHSHAELQKGFSIIPGKHFMDNLRSVANDGSFPMFRGILNSVVVSGCSAEPKTGKPKRPVAASAVPEAGGRRNELQ